MYSVAYRDKRVEGRGGVSVSASKAGRTHENGVCICVTPLLRERCNVTNAYPILS